ncbi:unnamed protein product [Microthlaspi erraticum]|uniref:Uncharacterized protein n=1 Tax=Microthlaspi erraticum TaxID=1685480 RepID=A0A6D2KRW7_9BRAS|nr:unnamed protein product [Microthlaspi erraticum]
MDAAQLNTQRTNEEIILKTSSTTYSTILPRSVHLQRCMTRRSNKDNLVEHPEIDKLEKQLRKQKAQEMADEAARAHAAEVARAQEEGRDPPPPPPRPCWRCERTTPSWSTYNRRL